MTCTSTGWFMKQDARRLAGSAGFHVENCPDFMTDLQVEAHRYLTKHKSCGFRCASTEKHPQGREEWFGNISSISCAAAEDALKRVSGVSSRRKTPPDVVNVGQLLPTCILGSAYLFHKHVQYIPHLAPHWSRLAAVYLSPLHSPPPSSVCAPNITSPSLVSYRTPAAAFICPLKKTLVH